ncbi:MAG: acetyltransferase [Cyclobacteriaceae bacterium]|nr:acetyltransferase [Cyclobacteriaceae bacterium]
MLIGGAGGHAIEILDILLDYIPKEQIAFFDDVTDIQVIHNSFPVLKNRPQVNKWFSSSNEFCIGVGKIQSRLSIYNTLKSLGGNLVGVRAINADVSKFSLVDPCADICKQTFISSLAKVGFGTLINTSARVHHHVRVGKFCEIGPGVTLLGGVSIGDECTIGGGATVLPKVSICNNAIVGGGAVVVRDITEPGVFVGNPAARIK